MIVHRAAWLLPIASPPIRDGWVAVENGRIADYGSGEPPAGAGRADLPFGAAPVAVLPGLVNAHTHLELSYLRGQVPPGRSFDEWVRALVALRRRFPDPFAPEILEATRRGIEDARASGTALVGDISNSLISVPLLRRLAMSAHVFHEVLGFNIPDAAALVQGARQRLASLEPGDDTVRTSLAPHAPYSVSPALFQALCAEIAASPGVPSTLHLGESPEEVGFLRDGGGPIRAALEQFGAWNAEWTPPGCSPVDYIDRFGLLTERLLVVHGVQLTDRELTRLAWAGATLVTCPRSNRWVGAGDPDVARFYASGVRVAIGTDSLASAEDLNLFAEMAQIRRLGPSVPARVILESATRTGADALGFGPDHGTIEPGKRAALIAVRVPDTVGDVEEYLLGGIAPADIRWLAAG